MPEKNENLPLTHWAADAKKMILDDLRSIAEAVSSNRYMAIGSGAELHAYTVYLTYRVQQDLFEVCRENGQFRDLSWDDFVLLLRGHRPARAAAIVVVQETLNRFYRCGHYNFEVTNVDFQYGTDAGDDETGYLHCAELFPGKEGFGLIENLLLHAEFALYGCRLNQHSGQSWDQFLEELERKGQLWSRALTGFRDALARLDFKPVWKSEELEDLVWKAATEE